MTAAPSTPATPTAAKADVSWWLFGTLLFAIFFALGMLEYITLYTEGEVMQGLFRVTVALSGFVALVLAALRRVWGIWVLVTAGGLLLCWQASQVRKWAMLHENVEGIIRQARKRQQTNGGYPESIDAFTLMHPELQENIVYHGGPHTFRLTYFMNDTGITYWYDPETGYGYYPD